MRLKDSHFDPLDLIRTDRALAEFPLTDLGNAERFAWRMRNRLISVAALGWLYWDGRRWSRNGATEYAKSAAQYTVRSIQREANLLRGGEEDRVIEVRSPGAKCEREIMLSDKLAEWGRESESDRHICAVLKQAAPMMTVEYAELNADPFKLNVRNGTIEIRRNLTESDAVIFRPHNPKDFITRLMEVNFNPKAACPTYDEFLQRVQPSLDVRRFLHQWAGLSATGDTSEQKLVFFWGKGRNGKTTLVETWASIFGDYACSIPIESLMDSGHPRSGGQATPDLALLPGARFVHTDEPSRNAKLSEGLVKLLTGGDTIRARELHKGFFSFKPQFKLTMSGNHRPKIDGGEASQGTWRRWILIRWSVTIPEADIDRHLPEKLRSESSGILNRILDGLRTWTKLGLQIPDEIRETTEDYRRDSDLLGRFLEVCTKLNSAGRVSNGDLYSLFCCFAKSSGGPVWHQTGLTRAMQERGFVQGRNHERFWMGFELTKSAADFDTPARFEAEHNMDDVEI
jgi:putative DNA primase/helicase